MEHTLRDAIQGRIHYYQARIDPLHSKVYNEERRLWIETLTNAPTDLQVLELEIGHKKQRREREKRASMKWRIDAQIEALEWVKGRMISQDFELWANAQDS
jgi:hypothetical protein